MFDENSFRKKQGLIFGKLILIYGSEYRVDNTIIKTLETNGRL